MKLIRYNSYNFTSFLSVNNQGEGNLYINVSHPKSELTLSNPYFSLNLLERLNSKPVLLDPLENTTAVIGSDAELKCEFLSDLNDYLQWFKVLEDNSTKLLQVFLQKIYQYRLS